MTTPISSSAPRAHRGFTLIELMVALAVVVVLVLIATPDFRDAMMTMRMSAQVNDLMSDLALARSEAIKRGVPVRLCASQANSTGCTGVDWRVGWMVYVDTNNNANRNSNEPILRRREAVRTGNTLLLNTGAGNVQFRPSGVSTPGGVALTTTFTMCDGRSSIDQRYRGRQVQISPTGRALSIKVNC